MIELALLGARGGVGGQRLTMGISLLTEVVMKMERTNLMVANIVVWLGDSNKKE